MSIETINYLLSKYYEALSSTQFLYQNELTNPSTYKIEEIEPKIRYKAEIDLLKRLIDELEKLKDSLRNFNI